MSIATAPLRIPLACALLLGVLSAPAAAVDGVLEINQTCAVQTGCFAGDAPGFPVTITARGSYRLTSALSTTGTAVEVTNDLVTLDLNGFYLSGNGSPGSYGVDATVPDDVVVKNGMISDFEVGIGVKIRGRLSDLTVKSCATGISANWLSTVRDSVVTNSSVAGIAFSSPGGAISDSILAANVVNLSGAFSNMGGNVCDGSRCPRERRRYYRTQLLFDGSQALSACAAGFHMANLHEIWDTTQLEYDTSLGQTYADSGLGPPTDVYSASWFRQGAASQLSVNCNVWTSNSPTGAATAAYPLSGDTLVTLDGVTPWGYDGTAPWGIEEYSCDTLHPVWCVED